MQLLQATVNHFSLGQSDEAVEIIIAQLFDFLQDGSWESEAGLVFTVQESDLDALESRLRNIGNYSLTVKPVENINWNAKWESDYAPVDIGNYVHIRADFHEAGGENFTHEIIINPNMAFGTGHHETTRLMILAMQGLDLRRKDVIDVGAGTGVLSILAAKENANVAAVEKHDVAFENLVENIKRNSVSVQAHFGGLEQVPHKEFDLILANITRDVHLRYAERYINILKPSGMLWLSGFHLSDTDMVIKTFQALGLKIKQSLHMEDWVCLGFYR